MNREIKFRVWDKQKKEFFSIKNGMVLGIADTDEFVGLNTSHGIFWIPNTGQKDLGWDRWIIQQYTGVKDKNDKKIYEGDIISITGWVIGSFFNIAIHSSMPEASYTWMAKVIYDAGYGAYLLEYINRPDYEGRGSFCGVGKNAEVIGNIFENPELLAEKSLDET